MKRNLGQYMTPPDVCALLASKVQGRFGEVIDLASGDCGLLQAFSAVCPEAKIVGVDMDSDILAAGSCKLPSAELLCCDGLDYVPPARRSVRVYVANPPYGIAPQPSAVGESFIKMAFPSLKTNKARSRLEIQFLCKYLTLLEAGDTLAIVLPASFADGETYKEYRQELTNRYFVSSVTEFGGKTFEATEAKTVALIISRKTDVLPRPIRIFHFDHSLGCERLVFEGVLDRGERMDAKYYNGNDWGNCTTLEDLGVSIARGRHSKKQASRLELAPIHTSDLSKSADGTLRIPSVEANRNYMKLERDTFAQAGDILLSRTGNRVSWNPVMVVGGEAPVTDHVFRIRLNECDREIALKSFRSPSFQHWLNAVCKGVCATVLTKKDLLRMPLFSTAS